MSRSIPIVSDEVLLMTAHSRANVLGVAVDATTVDQAVDACVRLIQTGSRGYVCATGAHGVIESQSDLLLRHTLNSAFLNLPDGMPTVWMGKLQGFGFMKAVRGPEFMLALCKASVNRQLRHFLYGGCDGVAEELANHLRLMFPGILICGSYTPPFRALTNSEVEDLAEKVQHCEPDIMWIGLSTPKQELFIARYFQRLHVNLMVGVGAAFDFHSGRTQDVPDWIKNSGLHWLFRMFQDPRRLLPRYTRIVPAFLFLALLQILKIKKIHYD